MVTTRLHTYDERPGHLGGITVLGTGLCTLNAFDRTRNGATDEVNLLFEAGARLLTANGQVASGNVPTTPAAHDTSLSSRSDVFVMKLHPTGSPLAYSTFPGGGGADVVGGSRSMRAEVRA